VRTRLLIGTAGWSIPRASAHRFEPEGTHLQRYARVFGCAEINSSFHRSHSAVTYARWASATPPGFRFAVKLPRAITHDLKLRASRLPLERFLDETGGLGRRRGPLLVQLPPSHAFDARVVGRFFDLLRARHDGAIVCEPRHPSWLTPAADALLVRYQVARVAAHPAPAPGADRPAGWTGIAYFRLHGAPRIYWSRYDREFLATLADALDRIPPSVSRWCVFDNTASGAALENAWELQARWHRQTGVIQPPGG
jgi:uncharacterized protein YecE (DUF72 family)